MDKSRVRARAGVALLAGLLSGLQWVYADSPEPAVDLTYAGSWGSLGGVWFAQGNPGAMGTGNIDPFLRVQANGSETGYNTDYITNSDNPDAKAGLWTHTIRLSAIPLVTQVFDANGALINGATADRYREFMLDINEPDNKDEVYLSWDTFEVYLSGAPDLGDDSGSDLLYADWLGRPDTRRIFEYRDDPLDGAGPIALNFELDAGSGKGDIRIYIPEALFTAAISGTGTEDPYLYVYTQFGLYGAQHLDIYGGLTVSDWVSGDGFEEIGVREGVVPPNPDPPPPVPEPSSGLLAGLLAVAGLACRRRRRS